MPDFLLSIFVIAANKLISNLVGLISTEDLVVMLDEMGIETNLDIDKVLEIGKMNERIVGRRLRSESIKNGRIPKSLTGR